MSQNDTTKINPFVSISNEIEHVAATIERFCTDIRLGHNIQNCKVLEGGNNIVTMFSYKPFTSSDATHPPPPNYRESCILRTKKKIFDSLNMPCESIKRSVAIMHTFGAGAPHPSGLPIPAILAYDSGYDNPIQYPYIIQRKAAGMDLQHWYRDFAISGSGSGSNQYHMKERMSIAEEMAKFIASVEEKYNSRVYGNWIHRRGMLGKSMGGLGEGAEVEITGAVVGGVRVPVKLKHDEWIEKLIETRLERLSRDFGISSDKYTEVMELSDVFRQMRGGGVVDKYCAVGTLWHPDLYPRNVVFDRVGAVAGGSDGATGKMKLTAVIDWDNAMVLPRIMTRKPPNWLWRHKNLPEKQREILKEHFYTCMERLAPGYREEAEGMEARVVRAMYSYALWGPEYNHHSELSYEGLLSKWDEMGVEDMF
ncbi:hypothetical protein EAE96_005932 [Botrytis aclada]|nr:hypothetical protein EAE96_005932 [Botrytis aclada]